LANLQADQLKRIQIISLITLPLTLYITQFLFDTFQANSMFQNGKCAASVNIGSLMDAAYRLVASAKYHLGNCGKLVENFRNKKNVVSDYAIGE
jgi:hypothetical protein